MKAPSFLRERKYRSVLVIGLDNSGGLLLPVGVDYLLANYTLFT